MKNKLVPIIVAVLIGGFSASLHADPKVYTLPDVFEGSKDGDTAGNPYKDGGKPLWQLDQVNPPDITQVVNYKPMAWYGDLWKASTNEFGGQPGAKVTDGSITLGVRGSWEHEPPMSGAKVGALIFIAPADATYTVTGNATVDVWQGSETVTLNVMKFSAADQHISPLTTLSLGKGQPAVAIQNASAALKAGDELIFVASPMGNYAAANIQITGLKIQ